MKEFLQIKPLIGYKSTRFLPEDIRDNFLESSRNELQGEELDSSQIVSTAKKDRNTVGVYNVNLVGEDKTTNYLIINYARKLSDLTFDKLTIYKMNGSGRYQRIESEELTSRFSIDNVRYGKVLTIRYSTTMGLAQLQFSEAKDPSRVVSSGCIGRTDNVRCNTLYENNKK